MAEACSRKTAIELSLDGRLSESEDRTLADHLADCAACKDERASLRLLRDELAALRTPPNAFVMRRLRRELLEGVGAGAPRARTARRAPWSVAIAGALLVAVGTVVAFLLWPAAPSAIDLTVTTAAGATYSREQDGGRDIVRLSPGVFEFDVHAHAAGRRLVFIVPDGEIEDIGTKFRVVVSAGHTEEIAVSEGAVEFRREGSAPLRLGAGMTYRRLADGAAHPLATVPSPSASAGPSPPASSAAVVSSATSAPRIATAHPVPSAIQSAASAPRAPAAPPPPSPTAPSATPTQTGLAAEDVAYMEVIRLLRAGKKEEARAAARRWSAQYPAGLRRAEMDRVAGGAP